MEATLLRSQIALNIVFEDESREEKALLFSLREYRNYCVSPAPALQAAGGPIAVCRQILAGSNIRVVCFSIKDARWVGEWEEDLAIAKVNNGVSL